MGSLTVTHNWFGDGGTDNVAIFQLIGGTNVVIDDNFVGAAAAANSGGGKVHYFLTTLHLAGQRAHRHEELHFRQHREVHRFRRARVDRRPGQAQPTTDGRGRRRSRMPDRSSRYWILENTVVTGARVAGEKMSDSFVHASSNAAQTLTTAVETAAHLQPRAVGRRRDALDGVGDRHLHDPDGRRWHVGHSLLVLVCAANTTGQRTLAIYKSNAPATRYSVIWDKNPSGGIQSTVETHAQIRFVEGDQFQCRATQNSGGNLDTLSRTAARWCGSRRREWATEEGLCFGTR
jgi:hypothetical protein